MRARKFFSGAKRAAAAAGPAGAGGWELGGELRGSVRRVGALRGAFGEAVFLGRLRGAWVLAGLGAGAALGRGQSSSEGGK